MEAGLTIDVKSTIAEGLKQLYALEPRQFPFIVALAMNRTMKRIKDDERAEMARVFDKPTAFTLNSLQTQAATKEKLEATIRFRDFAGKGVAAAKYLAPQIHGGPRRLKRFERALQANGLLPDGMYAVPGDAAYQLGVIDGNGNFRGAYITAMLSYLRANPDQYQNRTKKSSRAKVRQFFVITEHNNPKKLPMGVYARTNGQYRLIIAYVKQPTYNKLYNFYNVADNTAKKYLTEELKKAADYALRTSKATWSMSDIAGILR